MKILQPTTGDNNYRMNIGCMAAFVIFELVLLAALIGIIVGYECGYRAVVPFPKG